MKILVVAVMIFAALAERGTRPIKEAIITKEIAIQRAAERP